MSGSAPAVSIGFRLPPDAAFTCARCNRCCRGDWLIAITAEEAERLRALYPGIEPTAGRETLKGEEVFLMARRADGACVYLADEGCRVHAEHGSAAKPAVCRKFPYFPRAVGSTAFVHLSRMCPTVYAARGASGEELALDAALSSGSPGEPEPEPGIVRVAGNSTTDWAGYLDFENRLSTLLCDERWPLDDAVAAGEILLRRHAGLEVPRANAAEDEALDAVMAAIARREPMLGLYRYVMAALVTLTESRRTGRIEPSVWVEDLGIFGRVLFKTGRIRLRTLGAEVALRDVAAVPWPRRDRPSLTPLRSFLASHLHHKFLRVAPDLEYAYHLLVGAYAAVKFYARASAAAGGREAMTAQDLQRGIECAEYNLLLHRPLRDAPLEKRLVRGMFRKFLFHPSYTSSLVIF